MKQNCWGNDTHCWGSEAICVGEVPQIQSEITPRDVGGGDGLDAQDGLPDVAMGSLSGRLFLSS